MRRLQPRTRSRTDARLCALFDVVWSSCPVSDTCASRREAAKECTDCNRSSAFLDAHGARSVVSRIFSNAAMTRSRAGWIIVSAIIGNFAHGRNLFCGNTHENLCFVSEKRKRCAASVDRGISCAGRALPAAGSDQVTVPDLCATLRVARAQPLQSESCDFPRIL